MNAVSLLVFAVFFPFLNGFVHHKAVRRDLEEIYKSTGRFYTKNRAFTETPNTCSENAACVLPVQCPAHFKRKDLKRCYLKGGRRGFCCVSGQKYKESKSERSSLRVTEETLKELQLSSFRNLKKIRSKNAQLLNSENPPVLPIGCPSFGHFRSKRVYGNEDVNVVVELVDKAVEIALATKALKERHEIPIDDLEWSSIETPFLPSPCIKSPECDEEERRFRAIDGTCNNLKFGLWGSGLTPFSRLLPPKYHDGIWLPRKSVFHEPLPSPRTVSSTLFEDVSNVDDEHTMMLMQFGQFLSHDLTHSLDFTFSNGTGINCCGPKDEYDLPKELRHFACLPIEVPDDDEFYVKFNVGCINFVRSAIAPSFDCNFGQSQQLNKVTHFIDASTVYGSTEAQLDSLRSFRGGQLRYLDDYSRHLLPLTSHKEACLTMEKGSACFESGDSRTNQMITLVALHTLFMREHNRVARALGELNDWSDEEIFAESRRILIAELQVIVYKEFLPSLLGELTMEEFGIGIHEDGYFQGYDEEVEASITNEFATAAYRFGHSIVGGVLRLYGSDRMDEMVNIAEVMFHPSRMRKYEFFDEMLSTLTTEPIQKADRFMSDALTKYMFRAGNPYGIDLASLNIQRGRDHGLRPYNDYRVLVGLEPIEDFHEFGIEVGEKLKKIYQSPDDIDLWVGGLLEEKSPGSILGVTFRDIIADQFSRLKKGDRFYFENPNYFTLDQLRELKKVSLSRIICDNSDDVLIKKQAPNAFKKPGVPNNEFKSCESDEIPRVNLLLWKMF